ncbi:amino acid adenylation domain-containing protein [Myxococcus sp. XM-1-1-1]|uniref:non-ribosomal peptide synthetase n=1 Tax=Myxococcus sp. XM-1-1-1 TaxID=2874602 RepID=UPI001CBDBB74|nr:non-ribosomal peptide synthetase [Myxococcus sp. XM-1-1-1]MBZ4411223.1 amino acid adenylation domain-containing protein [Myxococcus sp. XM-1-1-1]
MATSEPGSGREHPTFVDLLEHRAEHQPERLAFSFLGDDTAQGASLTYELLARKAKAIAATLRDSSHVGDRALLLYPSGLDFIAAFFGCLYAGVVPVPAYPPRRNQKVQRLRSILLDSEPTAILTLSPLANGIRAHFAEQPEFARMRLLSTDEVEDSRATAWRTPALEGGTLAFLQYTSGSTSTPKGVMVSHANLLHNSGQIRRAFGLGPQDVSVTWLPSFHDMGLIDGILQPIYAGFPAHLMSPTSFLQQPIRWLKAISDLRATHCGGPNFAYEHCVRRTTPEQRAGLDLSCWTMAYNGAEPIRRATLDAFAETFAPQGFSPRSFYPCYGLAEVTLMVTGGLVEAPPVYCDVDTERLERHEVAPASEGDKATSLVGSGRVHPGTTVVIVDPESRTRRGADEIGEVWVSGGSVAMGYWRNAAKTEESFHAHLADTGEGPFLRTGDLGFFRGEELFVTGRLKDLLIIRGRNHYPQDLELTVARSHPALRPDGGAAFSIVVDGTERLVIAQEVERVALRKANVEEVIAAIRHAIAEHHELQAHAVILLKPGQLPKTSSGKIQRSACRARFLEGTFESIGDSVLASDPIETPRTVLAREELLTLPRLTGWLQQVVAQVLRLPVSQVDSTRTLLQLGTDSLAATELQHRFETELGVSVSLVLFLQDSTLEQLAAHLLEVLGNTSTPVTEPSITLESSVQPTHPLSRGQQALWFLHQLAPESAAYNVSFAVRIVSDLDVERLKEALGLLTQRHSALRTSFETMSGQPLARVHEAPPLDFANLDARDWSQDTIDKAVLEHTHRPFDTRVAPLLRTRLFHRAAGDHVLVLTAHHLVTDFWSLVVLLDELAVVYSDLRARRPVSLPPVLAQPSHHAKWQAEQLSGPAGEDLWRYWREQLAGARQVLALPTDRPRPPVQSFRGAVHLSRWEGDLVAGVRALAASHGATPYMVLLAAYQLLLHRYSGQDDLLVGTSVTGRTRSELAGTVGYLVNQLALRARLTGNPTFEDVLRQVRQTVLGALAHQEYPLALLVERLQPERDTSRSPLFQTMFVLEKPHRQQAIAALVTGTPGASAVLGDLTLASVALEQHTAQFDLTLKLTDGSETMTAAWEYSSDLFDAATVRRMDDHLRALLVAIIEDPRQRVEDLSLLSTVERRRILVEWNDTRIPISEEPCFHERFEAQAARTPDAIALVQGDVEVTYRQLNESANQVARHLVRLGAGPEKLVGLCLPRSIDLVVGLLGVLKAGGAYVPLDPSYPPQRLAYMLEDAQVTVLLTHHALLSRLPETRAKVVRLDSDWDELARNGRENLGRQATPANLAYIIYTSGSTGRPKGALIEHRGLTNYLAWCTRAYEVANGDGAPVITSIGFDATITGLFAPLWVGRKVILVREQEELAALVELLREQRDFSLVKLTPAHLDVLRSSLPAKCAEGATRTFVIGGEALSRESLGFWRTHAPSTRLINEYGPTETVVGCCVHEVTDLDFAAGTVPIGRPIANTRLYVLDGHLRPVPIGVPGELHIAGAGVARGYLRRPELTAERFLPDPFHPEPGERMYKTGDLARYLPDGTLEFLGRIDDQVKLRGFRIELGEIEAALRQHPEVLDAAVAVRAEAQGDKRLVAYLVWKTSTARPGVVELRRFLADSLPPYMVPSAFVTLAALPLTSHGKVDRRALPAPDTSRPELAAAYVLPGTELEQTLAALWRSLLRVDRVGVDDNFFELGGHSLLATQMHHQLQETLKRELPLVQLFQHPTIRSLAAYLSRGDESATDNTDLQRIQDRIRKQKRALDLNRRKKDRS